MLLLYKDSANVITVTASEKQTIAGATFLFELKKDDTNKSIAQIVTDTSLYPARYNMFGITMTIPEEGFYRYNIYEQSSSTNIDPLLADNLIETGKAWVLRTPITQGAPTDTITFNIPTI